MRRHEARSARAVEVVRKAYEELKAQSGAAVFIAAAGLIIARAAGCMGRSSGDEGKPLAEEGKAPRERRARANSNTAVQWQMH